ncbi:helix-turn-helix domain-containing protein [Streptomyces sp. bgisy154]|uniref:helix-turn-helix domain-containing protein n=1 Tax=Streptomyces sp. bgisy154 TaxID=3413794 RepID=UPI003D713DB0
MSRRNADGGAGVTTAAVFGEVLKHFREAAGLTQGALALEIPCDRSHVARIEAGTRVPTDTFAKQCDELLGTGGVLGRLWGKIDWYPEVQHPDWFQRRADMDAEAVRLYEYQEAVVPGLLQTYGYAWTLFSRILDKGEAEARVRARLSRQQRFLADDGPLYVALLDESCLRNMVGCGTVMREQCAHLLNAGRRRNILVQVVPSDHPDVRRPNSSMSLIELPKGDRWVYSESLDRGHFNNDPSIYLRHSQTYDVLRADALSARDSATLISDVMGRYEHHDEARVRCGDVDQEQSQRRQRRQLRRNRPRYPRRRARP